MTISSVTSANLTQVIREMSPKYFGRGINQKAPLLRSGALKKEKGDGDEYVVTLFPSANPSTGFTLDGGTLPTGHAGLPIKARAMPRAVVSVITQGRAASKMNLQAGQVAKLLDAEMKERAADVGRLLNRAIIGGSIAPAAGATWSGTAADSTVTVEFLDISLFRVNMAVDFRDVSGSKAFTVRVTAVTPKAVSPNSANIAGEVSFINDIPNPATGSVVALDNTTVATGDSFVPRGATAGFGGSSTFQGALPNSFDDIAGSSTYTSAFMGVTPSSSPEYNWVGQYLNHNAAYSQEAVLAFASRVATQSDSPPDVALMHPMVAAAHRASSDYHGAVFGVTAGISAGHVANITRTVDKYGNVYEDDGLRLSGAKVIQDPNCQPTRVILFSSEWTKLVEWAEMGPDDEAGSPILLSRSTYSNDVQISGLYNLVTDKRISVGIFDGITGL